MRHNSNFYPHLFDHARLLSTSSVIGRLQKFKMAAIETGSGDRLLEIR
jgi:hypothetical protein